MLDKAQNHENYMRMALELARIGESQFSEVPVGAVLVRNNEVVAKAHNLKESNNSPTSHAEILALEAGAKKLGRWRLDDCTLYVTLEPCTMCAGALIQARLKNLVFGAEDPKAGAVTSLFQIASDPRLNHSVNVEKGVLNEECSLILKDFFKKRREEKKEAKQ